MSTMHPVHEKCSMCGQEQKITVLGSTNAFGSADLDRRPPPMARNTMSFWIHKCSFCGYAAPMLEDGKKSYKKLLESEEYRTCDGLGLPSLADTFYKRAMLDLSDKDYRSAFFDYLHAAWSCDDSDDEEDAVICRNKCAECFEKIPKKKKDTELYIVCTDVLRRAGNFDKAIAICENLKTGNDLLDKIAAFEKELCEKQDRECHIVSEANHE